MRIAKAHTDEGSGPSGVGDRSSSPRRPSPPRPSPAARARARRRKQNVDTKTLIVAVSSDMQNLDPTLSSADVSTQETADQRLRLADRLQGRRPRAASPRLTPNEFVGAIAKSFSWNKNHTVVTFHLRKGVKFANGDPLDADGGQVHLRPDLRARTASRRP